MPHVFLSRPVGKVGVKVEPAGKTRLFMMLDCTSQRLLKPLHDWVFSVLRLIPFAATTVTD